MTARGATLAARIRSGVEDLGRVRDRVARSWAGLRRASANADEVAAYLDSVAFNLHGIYSGVERLLELVAKTLDGQTPSGDTWHRDLIRQVAAELPAVRPAVVGPQSAAALDELRRFRHLARNVYATNLIPERVAPLVATLEGAWETLRKELLAFAAFLDAVGDGGRGP